MRYMVLAGLDRDWLFAHGADVRTNAAIDAEAGHGLVEAHA